jgi:hypothetical protein
MLAKLGDRYPGNSTLRHLLTAASEEDHHRSLKRGSLIRTYNLNYSPNHTLLQDLGECIASHPDFNYLVSKECLPHLGDHTFPYYVTLWKVDNGPIEDYVLTHPPAYKEQSLSHIARSSKAFSAKSYASSPHDNPRRQSKHRTTQVAC